MIKRWKWLGLYTLLIYITIPFGTWLVPIIVKLKLFQNLLISFTLASLFLYAASKKNLKEIIVSILVITIFSFLIFSLKLPEERLHYVEYGILGFIIFKTIQIDSTKKLIYGILFVFIIGLFDEIIQYFLPNRVGDIRDVFMNLGGGILGIYFGKISSS